MPIRINLTFCRRWDLDNVISQTHVFAKAVSDVVDGAVLLDVRVRRQSVHREVLAQIHLVGVHVHRTEQWNQIQEGRVREERRLVSVKKKTLTYQLSPSSQSPGSRGPPS